MGQRVGGNARKKPAADTGNKNTDVHRYSALLMQVARISACCSLPLHFCITEFE